jgi:type I restriction enzyme S subunit
MRVNYKPIGKYIQRVEHRNRDLKVTRLLGLSMTKEFRETTSNIVGTDMSVYRVMSKYQFACDFMSPIRVNKLPVVLKLDDEPNLVSPAYPVFEIKDRNELDPEYLMMWFRRPEFDRYATFKCDAAIRGGYEWTELCETLIPVPSITKQREIVKEYNVIQNRIALNQQLIQKLEETAQAIYRAWFVEFEFPDEKGKPYKSNGGEMVWNEELEKEIPIGWENITVKDFCIDMKSGGTPSRINSEYWNSNDVPWLKTGEIKNNIILSTEEYTSYEGLKNSSAKLLPKDTVLMSMYGVNAGEIGILKFEASTNQACCGMICKNQIHSAYLYFHLLHNQEFIASQSIGGAQENLSKDYVEKIPILKPVDEILEMKGLKIIIDNKEVLTKQIQKLTELKDLLLSKLATIENCKFKS